MVAGWGGAYALTSGAPRHKGNVLTEGRILTFKLGGEAQLPETQITYLNVPEPQKMAYTPEQRAEGELLFARYCAVCHGPGAGTVGPIPNLLYSGEDVHAAWDAIVVGGARENKGMPKFDHAMDVAGSQAIRAYVIDMAKNTIALCESDLRVQYPELLNPACQMSVATSTESAGR